MKNKSKNKSILAFRHDTRAAAAGFLLASAALPAFAADATWNGTTNATWATGSNWSATPVPGTGNTATFDNVGGAVDVIDLGAGVTINSLLFDTANVAAYTIGSSGQTLNLNNGGNLTVSNTVTAIQTISANVVLGGNYTITHNGSNLLSITNRIDTSTSLGNITLTLNGSGSGTTEFGDAPRQATGTTLALNVNTSGTGVAYFRSGDTIDSFTLTQGIVAARGSSIFGGAAPMTFSGGQFGSVGSARSFSSPVTINGNFALGGVATYDVASSNSTFSGSVDLAGGTRTITLAGNTNGFNGVVSNGGLTLAASGGSRTLFFGGANTYSGDTSVGASVTLRLDNNLALQNSALDTSGAGVISLNTGITTPTLGGLKGSKNLASVITTNYNLITNLTLNPGTGASNSYSGNITEGAAGMSLTKTGNGTQTLSGTNTYSGPTRINGGTLAITGAGTIANTSQIRINTSTTLDVSGVTSTFTLGSVQSLTGGGTVLATGKTVNIAGTLAPGASPGTLTQDGGTLQLAVGGDYNFEIHDASGAAGTGYDTTNLINGATLDLSMLSAGNTFNINLWSLSGISPDVNGDATNFNNALAYSWTLFSSGTTISGFSEDLFTINTGAFNGTNGFTNALGGGTFSVGLADGNTNLVLNFTPVPEPKAALLGAIGMLLLLRRHRD